MRRAVVAAVLALLLAGCTQPAPPPPTDQGGSVVLLSSTVAFSNEDADPANEVLLALRGTGDDGRPKTFAGEVVLDLWNGTGVAKRSFSEGNRRALLPEEFDLVNTTYVLIVNGLPFADGVAYSYRVNVTLAAGGKSLGSEGTFTYIERS